MEKRTPDFQDLHVSADLDRALSMFGLALGALCLVVGAISLLNGRHWNEVACILGLSIIASCASLWRLVDRS